jgi:endoglucanase
MITAVKDIPNILPSYDQPAALYFKTGATVTSQSIALDFNGNTILTIVNGGGKTLKNGVDYTVTSTGVTMAASYLSTVLNGAVGVKDVLTIKANRGINLPFNVVLYDTPTIAQSTYTLTSTSDLYIPFDGKGSTLATVKAVKADGTFLKDDWTQWLGPLQQGRINWSDFDVSGTNIVLYSALLQTIQSAAQPVTLTFEFWPRTVANNVTATFTVV